MRAAVADKPAGADEAGMRAGGAGKRAVAEDCSLVGVGTLGACRGSLIGRLHKLVGDLDWADLNRAAADCRTAGYCCSSGMAVSSV